MSDDLHPALPAGVEVREARADDVDGFLELQTAVAGEGRWIAREVPYDVDASRYRFLGGLGRADRRSLVAVCAAQVVGCLGISAAETGLAELGMFVAADDRGQGVGSALLRPALAWATANPEVHKVVLQLWPHNAAALALYRRHGFQVEGYLHRHWRRRNGELWDAIAMGLIVTET